MISAPLKQVFESSSMCNLLHSPEFVAGVILGVSTAPEIPMPEQWMPWVLKGGRVTNVENTHDQKNKIDALADALIAQLQWQLSQLRANKTLLPEQFSWSDDEKHQQPLQQWLRGLLFAHSECEEVWFKAWQHANINEGESRLARCLKCFSVLADAELALSNLSGEKRDKLAKNLPILFEQLNNLLTDYAKLADELASTLPGQFEFYTK